ncbi:MAG: haloacid dehalogenase-like hydrolase [Myxococcales bacterium]|nr:haloacid dehalogenase-like hydrolase [Myxococcales bacterium]
MPTPHPKYRNSAAFYDVDGTLIRVNIVHAFSYYASRHASLATSALRTLRTAASVPVFWAADKLSRKWFNEIFYQSYAGASEDRLVMLADELFEDVIKPNIYPRAPELIADSRRAGCRQVLLSGALDFTMRPLAKYLGVDDLIANSLEFQDGYATGKLKKPFVAGATKADIMRGYARQHGIDLSESWAYSDSFSDFPMLAVVGHPTACNPDFRLLRVARSYDWPVLDLDEDPERAVSRRPRGLRRVRRTPE